MSNATHLSARSILRTTNDQLLMDEVVYGLQRMPKLLDPKWLYDEAGSQLFDIICELPEYYPTRTELQIMTTYAEEIAQAIGPEAAIIEFGSGTSAKTRLLLDHLDAPSVYVPVDIARIHLLDAASAVARDYPELPVNPVCTDFTKPFALPMLAKLSTRKIVYFPGSTLGNFESLAAHELLKLMVDLVGVDGALLIGIDLKKDVSTLLRAYNDAAGITSRFNLNALRHLNRALGADFPISAFEHRAEWVAESNRIEMRLYCKRDVDVHVGTEAVHIAREEYILTECCHKYSNESFALLAATAGLQVRQRWTDAKRQFSVQLLEPSLDPVSRHHDWFAKELSDFQTSLLDLADAKAASYPI